jgi:CubicO group peptidase (beta-lactamase class C family)
MPPFLDDPHEDGFGQPRVRRGVLYPRMTRDSSTMISLRGVCAIGVEAGGAYLIRAARSSAALRDGVRMSERTGGVGRRRVWRAAMALAVLVMTSGAAAAAEVWPGTSWQKAKPAALGVDATQLNQGVSYAKGYGGSGLVAKDGYVIASWGDQKAKYALRSATKSFGSILLGLAIDDGRLALGDRAVDRLSGFGTPPSSNVNTGWLPKITILQLATHTAGFDAGGGDYLPLVFAPGSKFLYSNAGANWLADILTVTFGKDLKSVLTTRVLQPLKIGSSDLSWNTNTYHVQTLQGITNRSISSGISADVNAMARIGLLMARGGKWQTAQILSQSYVDQAGSTPAALKGTPLADPTEWPGATDRYGLLWWNNASGAISGLPDDAFWAWGLEDSLILAVPSLDLVISRAGPKIEKGQPRFGQIKFLQPFFGPIAQAAS